MPKAGVAEVKVKVMFFTHGGCMNIVPLVLMKKDRPEIILGKMGHSGKLKMDPHVGVPVGPATITGCYS